jgi:hypothetical protein
MNWVPAQWESGNPGIQESIGERNASSDVEIKNPDYKLLGGKLCLIMNYKTLGDMSTREKFGNDKACGWIKKI